MGNFKGSFVILLVEDEEADAHLLKLALTENSMLVDLRWVVDGREALEYLRRQRADFADVPRPNLILLDLNMPRMNGREFLVELKRDKEIHDIPVVVMTTSEVQRDVQNAYELGASGFVTKPVDVFEFIDVVRGLGNYWLSLVRLPQRV